MTPMMVYYHTSPPACHFTFSKTQMAHEHFLFLSVLVCSQKPYFVVPILETSNVFHALVLFIFFLVRKHHYYLSVHKLWRRNSVSTLEKKVPECLNGTKDSWVGFKIEVLKGEDSLCTCNTMHT